jgi:hypothetical protein
MTRCRACQERGADRFYIEGQAFLWYCKGLSDKEELIMPSNTKMTELKRKKKKANLGKKRKKKMSKMSTPAFAIHVDKE